MCTSSKPLKTYWKIPNVHRFLFYTHYLIYKKIKCVPLENMWCFTAHSFNQSAEFPSTWALPCSLHKGFSRALPIGATCAHWQLTMDLNVDLYLQALQYNVVRYNLRPSVWFRRPTHIDLVMATSVSPEIASRCISTK